jgi:uracil-DNA glycosylase
MLIVGEYLSPQDEGVPFASPLNKVLLGWLRQSGIDPRQCQFTNVLNSGVNLHSALSKHKEDSRKGVRPVARGQYLRAEHFPEVEHLHRLINHKRPNLVLALGDLSLWALTNERSLKQARGRITSGNNLIPSRKVLPTFSPQQVMAEYSNRPILLADFAKAARESLFPEIRRPQRIIHVAPTLDDIEQFYHQHLANAPALSVDIETANNLITCIGFAPSPHLALVIPFSDNTRPSGSYWPTQRDEYTAWQWVRRILRERPSFGQNFQYDMQYLWRTVGIKCPLFCDDTMLLHHALQPELQKGLGFLASIYTDELAWKFMHKQSASDRSAKKGDIE